MPSRAVIRFGGIGDPIAFTFEYSIRSTSAEIDRPCTGITFTPAEYAAGASKPPCSANSPAYFSHWPPIPIDRAFPLFVSFLASLENIPNAPQPFRAELLPARNRRQPHAVLARDPLRHRRRQPHPSL